MTIAIIGGGIGGLTTAIALQQKGISAHVYEQAAQLKPVGAGIILANNAMQIYEKLGLREPIESHGNPISSLNITTADLEPLSKADLSYFEKKFKVQNIAVHRGKLQSILVEKLDAGALHLDHRLQNISETKNGYALEFENGTKIEADRVIGADGIHSKVRQHLFADQTIRDAQQICWRGITECDIPKQYQHELNEAWGKKERFGFVQIAKNKVYWYALKSYKNHKEELQVEDLDRYFSEYNPVIRGLISVTQKEHIHTAEVLDLKPTNQWYKKNICLIGDAAHAATPNMGQGACQAIEDAYLISECLDKYTTKRAFEIFQKLRLPKAHQVVKSSWRIGKIAHLSNPILIWIRNLMMQWMPASVNKKQLEQIFKLSNA